MKMITAIINNNDSDAVCSGLREGGFYFTKMSTTGGFLRSGNTTLLMGTEDDRVAKALDIIRANSRKRTVEAPLPMMPGGMDLEMGLPMSSVAVGGATVFVTAVEQFEKM